MKNKSSLTSEITTAGIKNRYAGLMKMSIADVRSIYTRSHRVCSVSGVPKMDLVTDIVRGEFGNRAVDAAYSAE